MSIAQLLPLVTQLGTYLKAGIDHYAMLKASGATANADIIALFLRVKLDTWDPKLNGKALLDAPTRDAAARFLAGVAVNVGVL